MDDVLNEARSRWLRPPEICQILRNYTKFRVSTEPPYKPPSGSLFIFDRRVLRCFRKDGHNWRKKKDGKTVNEAHERLKVGSIYVLHCYYAHLVDNRCFHRRSYWMLEEELSHIVLVHYLHVQGSKECINRIKVTSCPHLHESVNEESLNGQMIASIMSTYSSEHEDVKSGYDMRRSSNFHCFLDPSQPSQPVHFSSVPSSSNCKEFSRSSAISLFPLALARDAHKIFHKEKRQDNAQYISDVLSLPFTPSHQPLQDDMVGKEMVTSGQLSEDVFERSQELFNIHSAAGDLMVGQDGLPSAWREAVNSDDDFIDTEDSSNDNSWEDW